jgi:hypothetical protein
MRKAPFSGITALDPNESIYTDNSAFVDRDRMEIDRELKIGVKTHRHDAKKGLVAPAHAPSGLVIGSGGTIPGGLSLTLGLTFQDAQGGETLLGPTQLVTTPSPVQAPTTQLTAQADYTAGTLIVDTYTYAFTYLDSGGGETPLGPGVVITRDPGFANARIKIEGMKPGGTYPEASIVGTRLYRARAGGEYVRLADLTTNTFTDDGSASPDCDEHPPSFNLNTTGGTNQVAVKLGEAEAQDPDEVSRSFINLYCSQSGTFDESCLVGQYPTGSAGSTAFITTLALLDAQPPDVNRSFGGADKIDPDTELIEWHWKRPVATLADLPSEEEGSEEGDVRIVLESNSGYIFHEGEWQPWSGGHTGILKVSTEAEFVEDAEELKFVGSGAIDVTVADAGSGVALVTIAEPDAMGFVYCGEDLTKARPEGFPCVTWMTKALGESEPEHMAEHDILVALP